LWFAPLLVKNSPLLKDLNDFLTEFNDTFGEIDKVQTPIIKLHLLRQGSDLASVYTVNFHQLVCDINWNDNILINVFR
jgi:hypothetical protein